MTIIDFTLESLKSCRISFDANANYSPSVHWFWGTRCIASPSNPYLLYRIDHIAQKMIAMIQENKSKNSLSNLDIRDALEATSYLITLYQQFQNSRSLPARFFTWLWGWLCCQSSDAEQITALQTAAMEASTISYDRFELCFDDPSHAKLSQNLLGSYEHSDLEGTYQKEKPETVRIRLETLERHINEQRRISILADLASV